MWNAYCWLVQKQEIGEGNFCLNNGYEWGINIQKNNKLHKSNTRYEIPENTRRSQKVAPHVFYLLYTSCTYENFTELHYNVNESIVIFQCGLHPCREPSSTCEAAHVLPPSKSCSPPLCGKWDMGFCSACHCCNHFQRTTHMITWQYKVRIIERMRQTVHPKTEHQPWSSQAVQ